MCWSEELLDELESDLAGKVTEIERVVRYSLWAGSRSIMLRISVDKKRMAVRVSYGNRMRWFDLHDPSCLDAVVRSVVELAL